MEMLKHFDAYSQSWPFWSDHYEDHSRENHKQIMVQVGNATYKSMDDSYGAISKLLKPRKLGKSLKGAKRRTSQAAYQLDEHGENFIDNPEPFKHARQVAKHIADMGKTDEVFFDQLTQPIFRHYTDELNDGQIKTI
jgi:hypothetical protein